MPSQSETQPSYSLLPPRLILCGDLTEIKEESGRLQWKKPGLDVGETLFVPSDLQPTFQERVRFIDCVLRKTAEKLQGKICSEDEETRIKRGLLRKLFPVIGRIMMDPKNENRFFGCTAEQYIETAYREAKKFRGWVLEHLPPTYHQRLGLTAEVETALGFLDLLKMYCGISIGGCTTYINKNLPQGSIYSFIPQQVASLLECMNLYALADLTRDKDEEKTLSRFVQESGVVFSPNTKSIYLIIGLNNKGKCVQIRISDGRDWKNDAYAFTSGKYIIQELRVREFGQGNKQGEKFAVVDHRYKSLFSEMLKIARGRGLPTPDREAARFILKDKAYLDEFIGLLINKMPN